LLYEYKSTNTETPAARSLDTGIIYGMQHYPVFWGDAATDPAM
jgi:hypothetical protein